MNINFVGKYKSITNFEWIEIPNFVVITGPNGTGKSQLLDLIYNTLISNPQSPERVVFSGLNIKAEEVSYLKGEWSVGSTSSVDLATLLQQRRAHYDSFRQENYYGFDPGRLKLKSAFQEVLNKAEKNSPHEISEEEFYRYFPELIIQNESEMSYKIGEVFYKYRLMEIELQAKRKSEEEIVLQIGQRPWIIFREILKEAKLPFTINDPSNNGILDSFRLILTHQILNEEVQFQDLSSGEKVLISLVFYLYNSQEKNLFSKMMLMDEPDAHLHPSMSQQFLNVVKNVLVDKFGVRVIMTTHSPSTVILAPDESIYEMSRLEPRIKKSPSKNHAVSLLTSGLIYVGEGTKYFLVEDKDDVAFYSYVYRQLVTEGKLDDDIPLVFISASTKDKSGGKDVVRNWVEKLQASGLVDIISGLIDEDSGNETSKGVYIIDRYSIENYLADPILVYAALIDKEKNPLIDGIEFKVGEEYKLKSQSIEILQKIIDKIVSIVEPELKNYLDDYDYLKDCSKQEIQFIDEKTLLYPMWLTNRRGKTIIQEIYNKVFTSSIVNFKTLFKAYRKLNIISVDLMNKFIEIKQ